MMHRDIAFMQLEKRKRMDYLFGDTFANIFLKRFEDRQDVQQLYEASVNKHAIDLQDSTKEHIEALQALAVYRIDHYHSTLEAP